MTQDLVHTPGKSFKPGEVLSEWEGNTERIVEGISDEHQLSF